MIPFFEEIETVKQQIIEKFDPASIILFGSCAKGRATQHSDIDLCVILDTDDKRKTTSNILLQTESAHDLDIVVYTFDEWKSFKDNKTTLAGIINKTGVHLYG